MIYWGLAKMYASSHGRVGFFPAAEFFMLKSVE